MPEPQTQSFRKIPPKLLPAVAEYIHRLQELRDAGVHGRGRGARVLGIGCWHNAFVTHRPRALSASPSRRTSDMDWPSRLLPVEPARE